MSEPGDDEAVRRLRAAVHRLARETSGRRLTGVTAQDADDVTGTVGTDDAFGFDPLPLLAELDRVGAPVVVIGQVAGILHGSQELTGDLDLLWDGDPRHSAALAAAFSGRGARLTDDDGAPLSCDAHAFGLPKVVFETPGASGDLCSPALPWGDVDVLGCLARSLVATAGGVRIRYVDVPDLIKMRRSAGRPKDRRRADELARVFRSAREPLPAGP